MPSANERMSERTDGLQAHERTDKCRLLALDEAIFSVEMQNLASIIFRRTGERVSE